LRVIVLALRSAFRLCVLALCVVFGGGSSSDGCGGPPPGTKDITSYADLHCDTIENGRFPPGCPQDNVASGGGVAGCSTAPGQCPCQLGDDTSTKYCGQCPGNAPSVCTYCPSGTQCPMNPCDTQCPDEPTVRACPADAPVDCGGEVCCPRDYPVCCSDRSHCGATQGACDAINTSDNNNNPPQSSCGNPTCGGGLVHSQGRSGGCCSKSGCLASCTDLCDVWYEVNGSVYGPCVIGDNACLNNAAAQAGKATASCR
jgi:hypothetical protein